MKTAFILIALPALFLMTAGSALAGDTQSVILEVEGMTCRICPSAVKKAISRVEGVKKVEVSFKEKEARVEYEGGKATVTDMIKAVEGVGFKASKAKGD